MTTSFVSSSDAVRRLMEGNARFAAGLRSIDALASAKRLKELAEVGQTPFAGVLACSDSRVPTEAVFDCGLGELFVARVAGSVVSPHIVASLEYTATQCGSKLILVLGHTGCGAVKAAVEAAASQAELTRSLRVLVDDLKPAVEAARRGDGHTPASLAAQVERMNVLLGCRSLRRMSPVLEELERSGRIEIRGALFDMRSGRVELLEAAR